LKLFTNSLNKWVT